MMFKSILEILPKNFKRKTIFSVTLAFFRAILELVGIAVFIPLLLLLLDEKTFKTNKYLLWLFDSSGLNNYNHFLVAVFIILLLIVVIKSCVLYYITIYQNRYFLSLFKHLSTKLFHIYYDKGLLFIKGENSNVLTYHVMSVCYTYVFGIVYPLLNIIKDALFIITMLIIFSLIDIYLVLILIFAFVPVFFVYQLKFKNKLQDYGKLDSLAKRNQVKIVQETFKGYAEIEINNSFQYIVKNFERGLKTMSDCSHKIVSIGDIPSKIMEVMILLIIMLLVIINFQFKLNPESFKILLGFLAIAVLKLLPAVSSVLRQASLIKVNKHNIDILKDIKEDNLCKNQNEESEIIEFNKIIEVKDVSFAFVNSSPVLKKFNLSVRKGEKLGIKGASGSGKSTLFYNMLGLYKPDSGEILIDGKALNSRNMRSWQNIIGFVSQDVYIMDSSIIDNIVLGKNEIDVSKINQVIEMACLKDFIDTLPLGVNTQIGEGGCKLSGGQRQRLGIARALYKNADVLFFDEATSSLDSDTESEINYSIERLSSTGKELTIIVIAHRDSTLKYCDRVININDCNNL